MWKLKLIILIIFAIVFAGFGWWVSSDNSQQIAPVILGFTLPAWNLGFWLFLTLVVGILLGYTISWIGSIKRIGAQKRLQKQVDNKEREIAKMRATALHD